MYAGFDLRETRQALRHKEEPRYMGTFTGARRHVLHSFATTHSALHPEKAEVARRIGGDICARVGIMVDLGLGY